MEIIAVLFFLLIGICIGAYGAMGLWGHWQFSKRALRMSGVIVSYKAERHKGYILYETVAEFEFDGKKWQAAESIFLKPKIGAPCIVEVDPEDIKNASICSTGKFVYFSVYLGIGIFIVGGILACWLFGW